MANTDVEAIVEVITRDWRGKVRKSSVQMRAFENDVKRLNAVRGVQVRMPHERAAKTLMAASEINPQVRNAVDKELKILLIRALEATPIRTGALRRSGEVIKSKHEHAGVSGAVRFGGDGDVPYALYVHEDLTAAHKPPTQAKFLTAAANEQAKNMDKRMAERIQRYLEAL